LLEVKFGVLSLQTQQLADPLARDDAVTERQGERKWIADRPRDRTIRSGGIKNVLNPVTRPKVSAS
jgi:hypothetical protein